MQYFYVYILKCSDGSYYTGHTDNIEARISQHQQGLIKNCYTITRLPIIVVFSQTFGSRNEAFIAERKIKGWSKQKKLVGRILRYDFSVAYAEWQPASFDTRASRALRTSGLLYRSIRTSGQKDDCHKRSKIQPVESPNL